MIDCKITLTAGAGTTKGTFTQDGSVMIEGDVQAYYPSNLVQEGKLVWPAVQTNNQTVPMYSRKTLSGKVEDFNFSSLGAVLQIVFNTTQADVTLQTIEIKDSDETMSGAFHINASGKAIIDATDKSGIMLDLGHSGKVLGLGANYFYISIPAGNYQNLTLTFTAKDGNKCVFSDGKLNMDHNTVGRLTLTGEFKKIVLENALPGKFSVSSTERVHFSKGNLFYKVSEKEWGFYDKQYELGCSLDIEGHNSEISLFTWGYNAEYSILPEGYDFVRGHDQEYEKLANSEDWGYVFGGELSIWRTLSIEEWEYLFNPDRMIEKGRPCYSVYVDQNTIGHLPLAMQI